jgi:hypothetical protein
VVFFLQLLLLLLFAVGGCFDSEQLLCFLLLDRFLSLASSR